MKKFLFTIMAMFAIAVGANAQTVESGNNWFIGLYGGAAAPLTHAFDLGNHGVQEYHGMGGVKVGAFVTPVIGLGVTADGYVNTTHSNRWIDQSNVSGKGYVNVTNWLLGYNGQPRRIELIADGGIGWGHNFGEQNGVSLVKNFMTATAGAELDINLGKARAVQLFVAPEVVWGNIGKHGLDAREACFQVKVGFNVKFNSRKNAKKSRNFILVTPTTLETVREVPVEKLVEKVVEKTEVVTNVLEKEVVVQFAKASAELSDEAKARLDSVKGSVSVVATASPEGKADFNQKLSEERANVVANYLTSKGVTVVSAEGKGVVGETSNRVAIVRVN